MLHPLQALTIVLRLSLASVGRGTDGRSRVSLPATLTVACNSSTSSRRGRGRSAWTSGRWSGPTARAASGSAELALDEVESRLTVLGSVALVSCLVVAGAAVWISSIAVALDLAATGADEASGTWGELDYLSDCCEKERLQHLHLEPAAVKRQFSQHSAHSGHDASCL